MFLELTDYPTVIHNEILTALTRGDNTLVDLASNNAVEEMKGYLNARYDIVTIFAQTGSSRNSIVLKYALDIAVYNLYMQHNPQKLTEVRQLAYERAFKWLSEIQKGNINPPDLPVLSPQDVHGQLLYGGNPKRNNHF